MPVPATPTGPDRTAPRAAPSGTGPGWRRDLLVGSVLTAWTCDWGDLAPGGPEP